MEPSTSQRIPCLDEDKWDPDVRDLLSKGTPDGRPRQSPFLRTLAWHPGFYKRWVGLASMLQTRGQLPVRIRELVILRCALLTHAPNEWSAHVRIAKGDGLTSEEIAGVVEGPLARIWDRDDQAVLLAVDSLHSAGNIDDRVWSSLQSLLSEPQQIELVALAGQYHQVCWLQNVIGVPLPDGDDGLDAR